MLFNLKHNIESDHQSLLNDQDCAASLAVLVDKLTKLSILNHAVQHSAAFLRDLTFVDLSCMV